VGKQSHSDPPRATTPTQPASFRVDIVTLFPGFFDGVLRESILGRAMKNGLVTVNLVNLREFGIGKHKAVDDTPFGGGGGMTLMLEPLVKCLSSLGYAPHPPLTSPGELILTSAAGRRFVQADAVRLSLAERVTIICGHYLGVDERLLELYPIQELSIGDYTLTGGEPAAAVMLDAITRLRPGALGNFASALADSHQEEILGAPVYTRPATYLSVSVPEELLSGDHKKVSQFRRDSALVKTACQRPDILKRASVKAELSDADARIIRSARRKTTGVRKEKQKQIK